MTSQTADFVVLHTDGQLTRHTREGQPLNAAIRPLVVRPGPASSLGTQGMRRLRAWYDENFAGTQSPRGGYSLPPLPLNPLADTVLRGIGYKQPRGFWRGPVALSMEDNPYAGDTDPLTGETLATIEELAAGADLTIDRWTAARWHAPELVADLLYKDVGSIGGREVYQYEHARTHRLLNLELDGHAWSIAVREDGVTLAYPMDLAEALAFIVLDDDPEAAR